MDAACHHLRNFVSLIGLCGSKCTVVCVPTQCGYGKWEALAAQLSPHAAGKAMRDIKLFSLSLVAEAQRLNCKKSPAFFAHLRSDVAEVLDSAMCSDGDIGDLLRRIPVDPVLQTERFTKQLQRQGLRGGNGLLLTLGRIMFVRLQLQFELQQPATSAVASSSSSSSSSSPSLSSSAAVAVSSDFPFLHLVNKVDPFFEWTPVHNSQFLMGVCRHGLNYEKIRTDPEFIFSKGAFLPFHQSVVVCVESDWFDLC